MKLSFEDRYNGLNMAQKEAVDTIDGPVMVIAGPGTGKTTILTLRIANILKKTDIPPDAILALTFTESGVRSMRKKLADVIGGAAYRVHIHTFHGLANDIIKMYPDKFPRIIGSEHVEDLDQIRVVEDILEKGKYELLRPKGDPLYYVRKIISAIQELKRENIEPHAFEKLIEKQEKEILDSPDLYHDKGQYKGKIRGEYQEKLEKVAKNRELVRAYDEYEDALEKGRLYDFEDMIREVVKKLKSDEGLRLRLQEEYQYILADEHQDANNSQNMFLESLATFHQMPNLFIVGDEKQAIFRFQGASLENFLYFKKRFPDAKVIALTENYRSHQTILDASHSLIGNNPQAGESLRAELISKTGELPRMVDIIASPDRDSELSYVAGAITKLIESGTKAKNIAVLVRDNRHAEPVERALSSRGIPLARYADANALDNPYVHAFLDLLRAAADPSRDELVGKSLFAAFLNIDTIESSKALAVWRRDKGLLIEFLKDFPTLASFRDMIVSFSRKARSEPLIQAFEEIALESGFTGFITSHPKSQELIPFYQGLLDTVIRHAERNKTAHLGDFIEKLDHALEHDKSISVSHTPPEGVALMTAHGSKGLEFDAVFIVHAQDGVWGGRKTRRSFRLPTIDSDEDEFQDERRLFYVALTRARKESHISYHEKNADGKELSPTRFIYELGDTHIKESRAESARTQVPAHEAVATKNLFKDKEYLSKLYLERGLSVTHINNYLECPWKYFFLNLLRMPRAQSNPELYGSAMHAALKHYFDAYAREEEITADKAADIFSDYLYRTHMSEADFKDYSRQGKKDLTAYLSYNEFPRSIWNEFKVGGVPFSVDAQEILLNGNLDKVELIRDSVINVVDYKTGKPKSRNALEGKTKSADGNYKRQLTFYKILLDRYKAGEWKMETGTIDFISPDDKGKHRREVFSITEEDMKQLEAVIGLMSRDILSLSFLDRKCDDPKCEWCTLKDSASF